MNCKTIRHKREAVLREAGGGTQPPRSSQVDDWHFLRTNDGKLQKNGPDDASADGADMMASTRYAVMSWWTAAPTPEPDG